MPNNFSSDDFDFSMDIKPDDSNVSRNRNIPSSSRKTYLQQYKDNRAEIERRKTTGGISKALSSIESSDYNLKDHYDRLDKTSRLMTNSMNEFNETSSKNIKEMGTMMGSIKSITRDTTRMIANMARAGGRVVSESSYAQQFSQGAGDFGKAAKDMSVLRFLGNMNPVTAMLMAGVGTQGFKMARAGFRGAKSLAGRIPIPKRRNRSAGMYYNDPDYDLQGHYDMLDSNGRMIPKYHSGGYIYAHNGRKISNKNSRRGNPRLRKDEQITILKEGELVLPSHKPGFMRELAETIADGISIHDKKSDRHLNDWYESRTEKEKYEFWKPLKGLLPEAFQDAQKGIFGTIASPNGIKQVFSNIVPVFGSQYKNELPKPSRVGMMGAIYKTLSLIYVATRQGSEELNDLLLQQTKIQMMGLGVEGTIKSPKYRSLAEMLGKGARGLLMSSLGIGGQGDDFRKGGGSGVGGPKGSSPKGGGSPTDYIYGGVNVARQKSGGIFSMLGSEVSQAWGKSKSGENIDKQRFGGGFGDQLISFFNIGTDKIGKVITDKFTGFAKSLDESIPEPKTLSEKIKATYQYVVPDMIKDALFGDTDDTGSRTGKTGIIAVVNMLVKSISFSLKELVKGVGNIIAGFNNYGESVINDFKEIWGDPNKGVFSPVMDSLLSVIGNVTKIFSGFASALGNAFNVFLSSTGLAYLSSVKMGQSVYGSAKKATRKYGKGKVGRAAGIGVDAAYSIGTAGNDAFGVGFNKIIGSTGIDEIGGINPNEFQFRQDLSPKTSVKEDYIRGKGDRTGISGFARGVGSAVGGFAKDVSRPFLDPYYSAYKLGGYTANSKNIGVGINEDIVGTVGNIGEGLSSYAEGLGNISSIWGSASKHHKGGRIKKQRGKGRRNKKLQSNEVGIIAQEGEVVLPTQEGGIFDKMQESMAEVAESTSVLNDERSLSSKVDSILTGEARNSDVEKSPIGTIKESLDNINDTMEENEKSRKHDAKEASEEGSKGLWGRRKSEKEGEGEKGGFFGKLGGILSKLGSLSVSAAGAAGFAIAGLWIYNKLPDEVKQFYKRNWKGAMAGSIIGAGLGLGLGGLPGIPIGLALGATFGAGGQQLWTDLPPEVKEWLGDAYSKYSGYAAVGGVTGGLIGLITLKSLKGAMIGSSIGAAILPAVRKLEVDTGADKYIDPVLSALLGTYTEHPTAVLVGSAAGMLLATTLLKGGVKGAKIGAAVGGALAPILVEGAEFLGIDDEIAWLAESVIGFVADNSAGALGGSMIGGLLGLWKAPKGQKMRGFKIGSAVGAAVGPILQEAAEITGLDKALGWILGGASKLLAEHTTAALVGTMTGGLLGMYYAPPGMKMKGFGLGATVGGTIFPLLEDVADDYGVDKIFNAGIQFYKDNPYGAMGGAVVGAITGGIYGGFTPMMVGAGATLGSFVGGGIEWAGKKVADIFAPIVGPVAEFIGENSTGSVVGAVLGGVLAGVFSAGTAIPLGAMLGGLVGAGMEKGVKAVYGPVKEAWDYAMQFFTGIGTWVEQTIVSPIQGFFNTIVESLSKHVITPINNFFISISDFFTNGIRKMIGALPKGDWILSAMGWAPTPDESSSKNESTIKSLKTSSEEAFNSLSAEEKNKIESELNSLYPKLKAEAEASIPLPSTSIYGDIVDIMTPGAASADKAKTDRNLLVQQEVAKKMLERRNQLLGKGGPEEPVQNDPLASWQPTSAIGKLIKAGLSKVAGFGKTAIDTASNIINPVDNNVSSPSMQDLLSGYDKLPSDSITGITERAETGKYPGNPAAITNDVGGTRSYGLFQFNSKGGMNSPVGKFIFNSPWASQFQGYAPATREFENKWKEIASAYPEQFSDYQRKQIIMTHYMPLASRMMKFGWDTTKEPAAIQAMLLSTGVQFGPNTKVLDSIVNDPNWINKSPEEKIAAIANKKSIAYPPTAKRYSQEMKNAIAMLTPADKKDNMSNVDILKSDTISGINKVKTFMFGENKADGFWPVAAGRVTSNFGMRNDPLTGKPSGHKGIDLGTPLNSPVHSIASGTAKVLKDPGGYGNWIEIQHSNGTTSRYAHLNESLVASGDYVSSGQVIAKSGNTGRSTGPHLHFEVRQNNEPVNPMMMLGSIPPDTKPGSLDPNKTGVVNNVYDGSKKLLAGAAESTAGVVNDIAGRAGGPYTSAAIQNIIETQSKYDMARTNYSAASSSKYLQDLGDELGGVREGMNEAAGAIVNAGRTIVMTSVSNNKSNNNNSDSSGHEKEIKELVDLLMRGYDMGLA